VALGLEKKAFHSQDREVRPGKLFNEFGETHLGSSFGSSAVTDSAFLSKYRQGRQGNQAENSAFLLWEFEESLE